MKIIIVKEILRKDVISCYSPTFPTPCLAKIGGNGSVFKNWIVPAPSTIMAITSMLTGLYGFEFGRKVYEDPGLPKGTENALDVMKGKKIAISSQYYKNCMNKVECFGDVEKRFIPREEDKHFDAFEKAVENAGSCDVLFIQFQYNLSYQDTRQRKEAEVYKLKGHYGYSMYGLDRFAGWIAKKFPEAEILFASDHGLGQGEHPTFFQYAFHLYEEAINCAMIISRKKYGNSLGKNISARNFKNILLDRPLMEEKYIISETAYHGQKQKMISITRDHFKYIYTHEFKREELFDLRIGEYFDFNKNKPDMIWIDEYRELFDKALKIHPGRKFRKPYKTVFYYGYWDEIYAELESFRKLKDLWLKDDTAELLGRIKNGF